MFMHIITLTTLMASAMSGIILVLLALSISFIILRAIYLKTLTYETFTDSATIISSECVDNVMFTPDYYVNVNYHGKEFCIEDEKLYAEAVTGDNVTVHVRQGYDRTGKVRATYLTAY